jgi:4-aminobutyrate aminotransferase
MRNLPCMTQGAPTAPDHSEGDVNLTPARAAWARARINEETRALLAEDERVFLRQALSTPCLDALERSEGIWLFDTAGRRIMDFHGNSVHQLGHGHPRVIAAMKAQLDLLPFSPRRYTNRAAIDFAARLTALAPMQPAKLLLAPGGALAVGMALKLARAATSRYKTLSMWETFHGASLDAISVGGEAIFRREAGPLLPGTEHVPPPALAARFFGADGHAHERLADYIDYVLATEGDIGALIAEPMRWTTVELPPPGFWARVRRSCDRHGTLLIFDEIPSGLGRAGSMFVCEQVGAVPDMLVLGKGLGGGAFPLAALVVRADLDVMEDRALGHYTHEKSSVGCAAGLAALDVIAAEGLVARAASLGAWGLARLRARFDRHPAVRAVRGCGLYFGVELADAGLADRTMYEALDRGLSFKVGGGTVLTLCPPLIITEAQLDMAIDMLAAALHAAGAPLAR